MERWKVRTFPPLRFRRSFVGGMCIASIRLMADSWPLARTRQPKWGMRGVRVSPAVSVALYPIASDRSEGRGALSLPIWDIASRDVIPCFGHLLYHYYETSRTLLCRRGFCLWPSRTILIRDVVIARGSARTSTGSLVVILLTFGIHFHILSGAAGLPSFGL